MSPFTSFTEINNFILIWTITVIAMTYLVVSAVHLWGRRYEGIGRRLRFTLPFMLAIVGIVLGLIEAWAVSVVIAALYVMIPYSPGVDICTGIGIGAGVIIVYFHFGNFPFLHTLTFEQMFPPPGAALDKRKNTVRRGRSSLPEYLRVSRERRQEYKNKRQDGVVAVFSSF